MAFFEYRFPDRIAKGGRGGPRWKTSRAVTKSGTRQVNKEWTSPLHEYDVAQAIKTLADFEEVRAFFYVVFGAYDGFRYKDWTDYTATVANGVGTLVSGSVYQLYKNYTVGSRTFARKITKPVSGTVTFYRTRSAVTTNITSSSTIDTTTGRVTVTGHVGGDTYTWSGEFDVPVEFMDDALDAESIGSVHKMLMSWSSVKLREIRQ